MRLLRLAAIVPCAGVLPGCVFGDIRDQLADTNARLDRVQAGLVEIERTNSELEGLRERLTALDRLESIDGSLQGIDEHLVTVEGSLRDIDAHLASLRDTIHRIDEAIPFVEISGREPDESREEQPDDRP